MSIRRTILALWALAALAPSAWAQSSPGLIQHQVPTATQWNSYFSSKADNAQTATGSTTARTLADRFANRLNVRDFGAKGDCATDDTTAFAAAIAKATVLLSTFWTPVMTAAVYMPPGCYLISGVDLPYGVSIEGDGSLQVTLALKASSNRSLLTMLAPSISMSVNWQQTTRIQVRGFSINGNGSAQTAGNGIEFQDAPLTSYTSTGYLEDIQVIGSYNDNIYIGRNRNFGYMNGVVSQYTTVGSAVEFLQATDWNVSNFSFGLAHLDGLRISYANNNNFTNGEIYSNTGDGLTVQNAGGYTFVSNTQIAGNGLYGVYNNPGAGAGYNSLQLSNMQIGNNSSVANAGASQIFSANFDSLQLSNVHFTYAGGNNAAYLVDADTTGRVVVSTLGYNTTAGTAAGNAPYVTAAFRNPVIGPVNPSNGNFNLSVPLQADGGVTVAGTSLSLQTVNGLQFQVADNGVASTNFAYAKGSGTGGTVQFGAFGSDTNVNASFSTKGAGNITFGNGNGNFLQVVGSGGVAVGNAALATTATTGFFWIPSMAGTPTGAAGNPYTGAVPMTVDTTNNKVCFRYSAAWKCASLL